MSYPRWHNARMKNEKHYELQPVLLPFPAPSWDGSPAPVIPSAQLPALSSSPFPIAGFRHYAGAASIRGLRPGTRLTLRIEPTNPHDAFAVEILHGPAKLGYVPRFCNRPVNRLLLDSVPLACEVERVDPQAPPWEAVAVRVIIAFRESWTGSSCWEMPKRNSLYL